MIKEKFCHIISETRIKFITNKARNPWLSTLMKTNLNGSTKTYQFHPTRNANQATVSKLTTTKTIYTFIIVPKVKPVFSTWITIAHSPTELLVKEMLNNSCSLCFTLIGLRLLAFMFSITMLTRKICGTSKIQS